MDGALPKDFLSLFPQDGGGACDAGPEQDLGAYQQQQQQLNFDMLLMGAPPLPDGPGPSGSSNGGGGQNHAGLEHHVKLARLKLLQAQHEILQQQLDLISTGQAPPHAYHGHGLPTPAPSGELRAQPAPDYVSPMALHYVDPPRHFPAHFTQQTHLLPPGMATMPPPPPASAHPSPRMPQHHLHNQHHQVWSAPANLVFSTPPVDTNVDISPIASPMFGASDGGAYAYPNTNPLPRKRTASPGPGPGPGRTRRRTAAGAPPLLRGGGGRSRRGTAAPDSPALTPVTPASIMNMGGLALRSGLSPSSEDPPPGPVRARAASTSAAGPSRAAKKASSSSSSSPYKPILPAGGAPTPAAATSAAAPVKKITNHKESEQKRRDSLKAAYDALRGLLPAIPLPTEDAAGEMPVLPGALPPRGPPRGPGDGPNRGVSKLQLLRCGNAFIRALRAQVERRDAELERLRAALGIDAGAVPDIDEGVSGMQLVTAAAAEDGDEGDGDDEA